MFEIEGWVKLAPDEDERLRGGHFWIYSNEIESFGGDFKDGDVVRVDDSSGRCLGTGFANGKSKITIRLLTRGSAEAFSEGGLAARLEDSILRRSHIHSDAVRLVNAEADLLPGLVVDRYRDVVVVQTHILGWEKRRDLVVEALEKLLRPRAVVLKNDAASRKAEGLECYVTVARGALETPDFADQGRGESGITGRDPAAPSSLVPISEGGCEFEVDVLGGQKTGFYIDQRDNRQLVLPFVAGKRVLDCFCYSGAWSVMCAKAGAAEVLGLDCSEPALALARHHADKNGVASIARFEVCDVFDRLQELAAEKAKFDVVILDPPSLAKTRKAVSGAERGYVHLNRLALGLLRPGGLLATCSCSHHISVDRFRGMLQAAAALARRQAAVVATGGQPSDHPSLLGLPETDYLRCLLVAIR